MKIQGINKYHLRLYYRLKVKELIKKIEVESIKSITRISLESRLLQILEDCDFLKRVHGFKIFTSEEINQYYDLLLNN